MYFPNPQLLSDVCWGLFGLGGASVFHGWRRLRRGWMMKNMTTSKIRSVAMGLAELKGKAKFAGEEAFSPIRGLRSVWDRVIVSKRTIDSRGRQKEKVMYQRERRVPFYIEDDTGRILITPEKAEISGVETCDVVVTPGSTPPPDIGRFCDYYGVPWRFGGTQVLFRLQEWCLVADADIYVLGGIGKAANPVDERKQRLLEKLRNWRKDPEKIEAIDENKDGVIQQDEWVKARSLAQEEIMHEDLVKGTPAVPLIVRKPVMGFFIIASGTEADAIRFHGYPGFYVTGGVGLLLAGALLLPDTGGMHSYSLLRGLGMAAGAAALWVLGMNIKLGR